MKWNGKEFEAQSVMSMPNGVECINLQVLGFRAWKPHGWIRRISPFFARRPTFFKVGDSWYRGGSSESFLQLISSFMTGVYQAEQKAGFGESLLREKTSFWKQMPTDRRKKNKEQSSKAGLNAPFREFKVQFGA